MAAEGRLFEKFKFLHPQIQECAKAIEAELKLGKVPADTSDKKKRKSAFLPPVPTPSVTVPSSSSTSPGASSSSSSVAATVECAMKERKGTKLACAHCHKEAPKVCKQCGVVRYCGRDCQRTHWPVHKRQCDDIFDAHRRKMYQEVPFDTLIPRRMQYHTLTTCKDPAWAMYQRALFRLGQMMYRKNGRCAVLIPLHEGFPLATEDWYEEIAHWSAILPHVSALPLNELTQHNDTVKEKVASYNPRTEVVVEVFYHGPVRRDRPLVKAMASRVFVLRAPTRST